MRKGKNGKDLNVSIIDVYAVLQWNLFTFFSIIIYFKCSETVLMHWQILMYLDFFLQNSFTEVIVQLNRLQNKLLIFQELDIPGTKWIRDKFGSLGYVYFH